MNSLNKIIKKKNLINRVISIIIKKIEMITTKNIKYKNKNISMNIILFFFFLY